MAHRLIDPYVMMGTVDVFGIDFAALTYEVSPEKVMESVDNFIQYTNKLTERLRTHQESYRNLRAQPHNAVVQEPAAGGGEGVVQQVVETRNQRKKRKKKEALSQRQKKAHFTRVVLFIVLALSIVGRVLLMLVFRGNMNL